MYRVCGVIKKHGLGIFGQVLEKYSISSKKQLILIYRCFLFCGYLRHRISNAVCWLMRPAHVSILTS